MNTEEQREETLEIVDRLLRLSLERHRQQKGTDKLFSNYREAQRLNRCLRMAMNWIFRALDNGHWV
ncbi:MAG: hypothetical protein V3R87_02800 [Dehalococcoidia bacterium]